MRLNIKEDAIMGKKVLSIQKNEIAAEKKCDKCKDIEKNIIHNKNLVKS